jgi:hypothetical protein
VEWQLPPLSHRQEWEGTQQGTGGRRERGWQAAEGSRREGDRAALAGSEGDSGRD